MCTKSAVLAWTGARKQSSPAPSLPCPEEAMALFGGEAEGGGHCPRFDSPHSLLSRCFFLTSSRVSGESRGEQHPGEKHHGPARLTGSARGSRRTGQVESKASMSPRNQQPFACSGVSMANSHG